MRRTLESLVGPPLVRQLLLEFFEHQGAVFRVDRSGVVYQFSEESLIVLLVTGVMTRERSDSYAPRLSANDFERKHGLIEGK